MARRFAALVAALMMTALMAVPALAVDLQQDTPISWDEAEFQGSEEECADADVEEGEVLWHFVLIGSGETSATLTAEFEEAGVIVVQSEVPGENDDPNVLHFNIVTGEDTLLSASTNTEGGQLNLSHICPGGPPFVIPEAPIALLLPAVLVGALGAYLLISRRRTTSVA